MFQVRSDMKGPQTAANVYEIEQGKVVLQIYYWNSEAHGYKTMDLFLNRDTAIALAGALIEWAHSGSKHRPVPDPPLFNGEI